MPGYFAGAIIVFIWAFADLGTPLIFGYSRVVPVQIFDAVTEINTNPMGYTLVVVVLVLTVALFLISKQLLARKRYEMIARGHTAGAEARATTGQAALIWAAALGLILVALLPHLAVIVQSFSERWFFSVLPQQWTTATYSEIFQNNLTGLSIRNSLLYSSLSATLDLVLGVIIAWLLTRRRIPFAGLLDALAMLPLALPGIAGGAVMAWARALGEFGATILFAGNFQGRTQTMPLAIYTALESDLNAAIVISAILVVASFALLITFKLLSGRQLDMVGMGE